MTKYYPLIARAVAGLDQSTGEARRALYEHVRTALVNKLRGLDPPLSEVEITSERLGLEEAISRVEAEAARHPAAGSRPGSISRSSTTTAAEPYWRSRKAPRASERSTISLRRWGSERSRRKEPFDVPVRGSFLKRSRTRDPPNDGAAIGRWTLPSERRRTGRQKTPAASRGRRDAGAMAKWN